MLVLQLWDLAGDRVLVKEAQDMVGADRQHIGLSPLLQHAPELIIRPIERIRQHESARNAFNAQVGCREDPARVME